MKRPFLPDSYGSLLQCHGFVSMYPSSAHSSLPSTSSCPSDWIPSVAVHIITTPRCVTTSIVTWVFSGGITATGVSTNYNFVRTVVFSSVLLSTSTCYILIYYGVSKVPCTDNVQLRQRKAENMRVLRTFGMILGTSVACWILPLVYWFLRTNGHFSFCVKLGAYLMTANNWCANNSLIYWWR